MLTYKITDENKFKNVSLVEIDGSKGIYNNSFDGDVTIINNKKENTYSGEHGVRDYEDEYGFIIVQEDE